MTDVFEKWRDRIAWGVITGAVTVILGWCVWITNRSLNSPTDPELTIALETQAPYVQDRALIRETLDESKRMNREMNRALDNNTKAIIQLQAFLEASKASK